MRIMIGEMAFRDELRPGEDRAVRAVTESAGVFYPEEVDFAEELAREHLARGAEGSGYFFLVAERSGELCGYTCFGPIPGARRRYDLYWIAVEEGSKGSGLGRELMARTEARILAAGGAKVYVETSSRPPYAPARAFYRRSGYQQEAVLRDYYDDADDKVIFVKTLDAGSRGAWDEGGD
jgi:ribosomal protein S18 acetylase RimI-like enzyme